MNRLTVQSTVCTTSVTCYYIHKFCSLYKESSYVCIMTIKINTFPPHPLKVIIFLRGFSLKNLTQQHSCLVVSILGRLTNNPSFTTFSTAAQPWHVISPRVKDLRFSVHSFFKCYVSSLVFCFHHLAVWLTTGPKPLPKRAVHTVRSRASSFRSEYPFLSLRPSSSFLRLPPRLPATSILLSSFLQ
jgi:hypothetical protein